LIDNEKDILNILKNNPVCSVNYLIKGEGETDFENFNSHFTE